MGGYEIYQLVYVNAEHFLQYQPIELFSFLIEDLVINHWIVHRYLSLYYSTVFQLVVRIDSMKKNYDVDINHQDDLNFYSKYIEENFQINKKRTKTTDFLFKEK